MKITKYEQLDDIWYEDEKGEYHNINDEPAIICSSGTKYWFINGKIHRTKGPAVIYSSYGEEYWYYEGNNITTKVNQLMNDGYISSDWENWSEEDEFLFVLLV